MDACSIPKKKFSRRSSTKSKNGCFTCRFLSPFASKLSSSNNTHRKRRVKCDETRPVCKRCIQFKVVCDGYAKPKQDSNERRALKAKSPSLRETTNPLRSMEPSSIFLGELETENRYFRYFQQMAAMGLDGHCGWYLWNHVVPQHSHQEPFVWHAIIAVGALSKSHDVAYSAGIHPHAATIPTMAKLHRDFAISKYSTAIRLMRKAISAKTTNSRQALLGCIFISCFEMLIGNRHLAVKHARSGTLMLQQWQKKSTIEKIQPPLLSSLPLSIENEVVAAIQHLDIHITALGDDRSDTSHEEMLNDHRITNTTYPSSFENIHEAQAYLSYAVQRISHLISIASSHIQSPTLSKEFDSKYPVNITDTTNQTIYSTTFLVNDYIFTQQAKLEVEISNWIHAFSPLLNRLSAQRKCEAEAESFANCQYNCAAMMQMQAIATTISNAGIVMTKETSYDKFNPQFRELVDLATTVVKLRQQRKKDHSWAGGFWIDIGITPQLFVVVTRCRDPVIRRMAIKLLEGWYIEGNWDPMLITQIGLFMMEVEEERAEKETQLIIPETARAVLSRLTEDSREGWALMQCVIKYGGVDERPVWREKYIGSRAQIALKSNVGSNA